MKCPTEHIEFAVFNEFIGLEELVNLSMVNKSYNRLAKREIKKIYTIIEKIRKSKIKVNHSTLYSTNYFGKLDNTYEHDYWYGLFGRQLNQQELTLYYAYFITKYSVSSPHWCCVAYPDGFIKQLGSKNDGSVSLTHYPEIYIRFYDYSRGHITINFEYNFKTKDKIYIDETLLNKLVSHIKDNSKYDENNRTFIYPTINEAIETLYPLILS